MVKLHPPFDGADYQRQRDDQRLTNQYYRVWNYMLDGNWHTLPEIESATGDPPASISAQMRHMRKPRFGAHTIERKYLVEGLYAYRLIPNIQLVTTTGEEAVTETIAQVQHAPLITKYRPKKLDDVIGQDATIRSIKQLITGKSRPHAYAFIGPSGCGKTTIAKILANEFGCADIDYNELDAGTSGKVDNIRALVDSMDYAPLQGKAKVLVLDECHVMGKESWNALLKSIEAPPSHVYYIFCTTEESKIPETIKTRVTQYNLNNVPVQTLASYAIQVCGWENIQFPVSDDELLSWLLLICESANGSPRKMLNLLDKCRTAINLDEVRQLIQSATADENSPLIKICQLLLKSEANLTTYLPLIDSIEPKDWGGARKVLKSYMWKALRNRPPAQLYKTLEAIDKLPYFLDEKEGPADLGLMIGRITFRPGQ